MRAFTIVSFAAPGIPVPFVAAVVDCDGTSVRGNIVNVEPDPEHVHARHEGAADDVPDRHRRRPAPRPIGFGFEPAGGRS